MDQPTRRPKSPLIFSRELLQTLDTFQELVAGLDAIKTPQEPKAHRLISTAVIEPRAHDLLYKLLVLWSTKYQQFTGATIALALESAGFVVSQYRESQKIDIVWTGPIIHEVNLRRTENALLDLIESAEHHVHIVSFAIYKATQVIDALVHAIERGLLVSIYLETPLHSHDKIAYDTKQSLGEVLCRSAAVYAWPMDKRVLSADGKHGSLHAKAVVADGRRLFVSSANLTGYAMNLNIELGVLIHDEVAATKVEKQLELLVTTGIFSLI